MADPLPTVVTMLGEKNYADDPQVRSLVEAALARFGDQVEAIVLYGSFTRGQTDTLLDLYILLKDLTPLPAWQRLLGSALAPNVYQLVTPEARAKVAVMTFDALEKGVRGDVAPYFWARFAQPCGILYCRDDAVRGRVIDAICQSSMTFARRVAPGLPGSFDAKRLWANGLSLTYQCEFRSEPPGHAGKLFEYWPDYYRAVTRAMAQAGLGFEATETADTFRNVCSDGARRWSPASWWLRRVQGKVLSTLRLLKAALTFDGALEYLLWKIKRHSGVYIEPSNLQKKYPVIFAWPLLWRLWRKGAFQ